ncbi:hypothetical protein ACFE04_009341 [Oxalis oulophora]
MILETTWGSAMLGGYVSAFLAVLFDRVASDRILKFLKKCEYEENLIHRLKASMSIISRVLNDADGKRFSNKFVRQWLDELRHIAYKAEDLLDEFVTMEHNSSSKEIPIVASQSFVKDLKKISDKLESLADQVNLLGLRVRAQVEADNEQYSRNLF